MRETETEGQGQGEERLWGDVGIFYWRLLSKSLIQENMTLKLGHPFHSCITFLLCPLSSFWVHTNPIRSGWWEGQGLHLAQGFSRWALTHIWFNVSEPRVHDSRGHLGTQILYENGRNRAGSGSTTGLPSYLNMRVKVNLEFPPRALPGAQWRQGEPRGGDKGQRQTGLAPLTASCVRTGVTCGRPKRGHLLS